LGLGRQNALDYAQQRMEYGRCDIQVSSKLLELEQANGSRKKNCGRDKPAAAVDDYPLLLKGHVRTCSL